jgi:hypothetical protein
MSELVLPSISASSRQPSVHVFGLAMVGRGSRGISVVAEDSTTRAQHDESPDSQCHKVSRVA